MDFTSTVILINTTVIIVITTINPSIKYSDNRWRQLQDNVQSVLGVPVRNAADAPRTHRFIIILGGWGSDRTADGRWITATPIIQRKLLISALKRPVAPSPLAQTVELRWPIGALRAQADQVVDGARRSKAVSTRARQRQRRSRSRSSL